MVAGGNQRCARRLAHHERVVSFAARQLLDTASPTNFPWTNPEALEATAEQRGANLIRGMSLLADDWRRLRTITLFATETDFTEPGEFGVFLDESQVSDLESLMWEQGYLDSTRMAGAFEMLQPYELIWSRVIREYLLGERARPPGPQLPARHPPGRRALKRRRPAGAGGGGSGCAPPVPAPRPGYRPLPKLRALPVPRHRRRPAAGVSRPGCRARGQFQVPARILASRAPPQRDARTDQPQIRGVVVDGVQELLRQLLDGGNSCRPGHGFHRIQRSRPAAGGVVFPLDLTHAGGQVLCP